MPLITKYVVQDGKWVVWEDSEYASGKRKLKPEVQPAQPEPPRWAYRCTRAPCAHDSCICPRCDRRNRDASRLLGQYVFNGLMLGMIYAMVAVGFTLFFGVLDVIKFSHGDVLMVGAFTALATYLGLQALGVDSPLAAARW